VQGLSLEVQAYRIRLWCEAQEADLVDVIEDAGISGAKALAERPGGSQIAALLRARDPGIDAVAIVRLDRLGRDAAETLTYLRRFAQGHVGLVSIRDRLDLTTPQGRAMAGVAAVFSELERELIGARTAEALAKLKAEGRRYGPLPYGFDAKRGRLIEKTDEQRVLRKIQGMRKRCLSYRSIADWLNAEAICAKRGGTWSPMAVRSVCLTSARRDASATAS
jgi:site-specific DNA recombinase